MYPLMNIDSTMGYARVRIIPVLVLVSLLILTLPHFGFPIQSAQAQSAVDLTQAISQANGCDEEDDGNNFASCINEGTDSIASILQRMMRLWKQ